MSDLAAGSACISVESVLDVLAAGYTSQEIRERYDHLTADDIQARLAHAKAIGEPLARSARNRGPVPATRP